MHRQVTISLDHAVDDGLSTLVGHGRISKFIEDAARAPVLDGQLYAGYRAMAADAAKEGQAREWIAALASDNADAAR